MASSSRDSLFSYTISRRYPFPWFTYVAVIGGIVCTILFSFVALAANGYEVELQYTPDLPGTLGKSYWFQKPPFSWISPTKVDCQDALLTPGATYFTANLGLIYTLSRLWQEDELGAGHRTLPAAAYSNANLRECQVREIQIDFFKRSDFSRQEWNPWTWGTTAKAFATCEIHSLPGSIKANFSVELPSLRDGQDINSAILSKSVTSRADIWFGVQLAFPWYDQLPLAMGYQAPSDGSPTWDSGLVRLWPNDEVKDYTNLEFFHCSVVFYTNEGWTGWMQPPETVADWGEKTENGDQELPEISLSVDAFGKSFYSLLLSDLGVADETNALITPSGVRWLESRIDEALVKISEGNETGYPSGVRNHVVDQYTYPLNQTYQLVTEALGSPPRLDNIAPTTLFTQYLCSIPRQKSGGSLVFGVLLADLVFLQAMWRALNFLATWWVQRKDVQANHCEGCRDRSLSTAPSRTDVGGSQYELIGARSKTSGRLGAAASTRS